MTASPTTSEASRITLTGDGLTAEVDTHGAQLMRLDRQGEPLLWPGDPAGWADRAPLLFPVIGLSHNGEIRVDGRAYPMPQHGFARHRPFVTTAVSQKACTLTLASSPETQVHYPFPFRLEVTYSLAESGLRIAATIHNSGRELLPASFGFHPGFRWPLEPGLPKTAYRITLEDDERIATTHPVQGRIGPDREEIALPGGVLPLHEGLFVPSGLFLLTPKSRRIRYDAEGGGLALVIEHENCRDVMLWMRPGFDFLCIEPWHGMPDPVDFTGEFRDKPGLAHIPPGESLTVAITIRVEGQSHT